MAAEQVRIIKGKYAGQEGSIHSKGFTAKMVYVQLANAPEPVRVSQTSIRMLHQTNQQVKTETPNVRKTSCNSSQQQVKKESHSVRKTSCNSSQQQVKKESHSVRKTSCNSQQNPQQQEWQVPDGEDLLNGLDGLAIDCIRLLPKTRQLNTFSLTLFQHRLLTIEIPMQGECMIPSKHFQFNGFEYSLLSTKLKEDGVQPWGQMKKTIKMNFIAISSKIMKLKSISLANELEKIGHFRHLTPGKAKARLELFESPAKSDKVFTDLSIADFETIEEISHEGCGYIPDQMIKQFFGSGIDGTRTMAIQVRIFAPRLGLFKGILRKKAGIHKIQLPTSMQKVGPSIIDVAGNDWVCLIINKSHPSTNNRRLGLLLKGSKVKCKSFPETKMAPSKMILRLWQSLGIPKAMGLNYAKRSITKSGLKHAWLAGTSDPTNALPEGSIFISGMSDIGCSKVFITRSPCVVPADGRILPVIDRQPKNMTDSDWNFLNNEYFGCVTFAHSSGTPLPKTIANGDLDGDLYFICWDDEIINNCLPQEGLNDICQHEGQKFDPASQPNLFTTEKHADDWFQTVQDLMLDVSTLQFLGAFIGFLYKKCESVADNAPDFLHNKSSKMLGQAYKDALDIEKHGGRVHLSMELIEIIPKKFHSLIKWVS